MMSFLFARCLDVDGMKKLRVLLRDLAAAKKTAERLASTVDALGANPVLTGLRVLPPEFRRVAASIDLAIRPFQHEWQSSGRPTDPIRFMLTTLLTEAGLTAGDIAELLGVTKDAVRKQLRRAAAAKFPQSAEGHA